MTDFERMLDDAEPWDVIEYYRGELGPTVERELLALAAGDIKKTPVADLASEVRTAAEYGLVILTQERHGPHDFSYLATVRP